MTIDKNKVVAVSYELEVEGSIADKAGSEKPLEYIHGTGMLLPKFEAALEGKEPGASFDFTLTPEEGYGNYSDEWKIEIPKTSFAGPDGKIREDLLVVGFTIPMLNSEGQQYRTIPSPWISTIRWPARLFISPARWRAYVKLPRKR